MSNIEWLSQITNQYYGCNGGPCGDLNRLLSTPEEYSAFTQPYIDCLPDPTPFPCSAITHCVSGKTGTDTFVTGTTLSGDKSYTTRNDSEQVLILSAGTNTTFTNPSTNLIKIDSTDTTYSVMTDTVLGLGKVEDNTTQTVAANAVTTIAGRTYGIQKNSSNQLVVNIPWRDSGVTPILIVSNAMSISNPVGTTEYIGDSKAGGWNSTSWNLPKPSFTYANLNCGVPFPHTINGSVTNAFNVCGNLYVQGNRTQNVTVNIKIYTFECVEGSNTPALTQLATTSLEFEIPEGEAVGSNKCWSIDVNSGENPITECTTHLIVSFTLVEEESGVTIIKSSYKATIENIA